MPEIDYDSIDLQLSVEDMLDLEEADVVSEDRWEVDSKELKAILGVVKSIVSKSPVEKAVRFEATKFGLHIYCTDSLSFLQYEANICNSNQVLQGSYTVSFSSLDSLIPMLPKNKTVIYKRDNFLYIQLVGGSFPVNIMNTDIFSTWDSLSIGTKIGKIKSDDMKYVIHDVLPYISQSEQPTDRKISFDVEGSQTYAFGSYKWSMVRTPIYAEGISDVDIRYKDLQIIKQLLSNSSGEFMHLYEVNGVQAIAVQSLHYTYMFMKSNQSRPPIIRTLLNNMIADNYTYYANYAHLFQVLRFANSNQEILEEIRFRVSNQFLFIEVELNNGIHSTFKIMGHADVEIPSVYIRMHKEVALSTLRAITMEDTRPSSEIRVIFSKDSGHVGFSGLSDSIMSCSQQS